ncbi:hypothetical protein HMI56_001545 [Coelomomyces lativittatus]|nr:hypothetical protein HMI56_001545 [Coelomomyces lativittatus]
MTRQGLVDYTTTSSSEHEEEKEKEKEKKQNNNPSRPPAFELLSNDHPPRPCKGVKVSSSSSSSSSNFLFSSTSLHPFHSCYKRTHHETDAFKKKKKLRSSVPSDPFLKQGELGSENSGSAREGSKTQGQWLTHLCILVSNPQLPSLLHTLLVHLQSSLPSYTIQSSIEHTSSTGQPNLGYHVSLSKAGLQLKRFQIHRFVELVKKQMKTIPPFQIQFGNLSILPNESKTKYFFCVDVVSGIPKD